MIFCCSIIFWRVICLYLMCIYCLILDFSLNVKLDMCCRVGHVCATCFIESKWAFRLLWLHCFKPHEHQFAGKVNAVYDFTKLRVLCRVRKPPVGIIQLCPMKNCTKGRKCNEAHSTIEFDYWNIQQSMYVCMYIEI